MGRSAQPNKKVVNMGHPAQPSKKVVENHKRSLPALSHIGGRVIYTIVAWFVLALDVSPTSFFVSLFLFVLPVLMDCIHFGYEGWSIKKIIDRNIDLYNLGYFCDFGTCWNFCSRTQ